MNNGTSACHYFAVCFLGWNVGTSPEQALARLRRSCNVTKATLVKVHAHIDTAYKIDNWTPQDVELSNAYSVKILNSKGKYEIVKSLEIWQPPKASKQGTPPMNSADTQKLHDDCNYGEKRKQHTVLIQVLGGSVVSVHADHSDINVIVIDHDDADADGLNLEAEEAADVLIRSLDLQPATF